MPAQFRDHLSSDNASGANTRLPRISSATTIIPPTTPSSIHNHAPSNRRHRVNLEHGIQQIVHHLALALLPRRLDLADLGLRLLVGLVLGRLVALCVLRPLDQSCPHPRGKGGETHLSLKLLELGLLLGTVRLDLLFGLVARFPHFLGAVWERGVLGAVRGERFGSGGGSRTFSGWGGHHVSPGSGMTQEGRGWRRGWRRGHTLLNNLGCLPLGL